MKNRFDFGCGQGNSVDWKSFRYAISIPWRNQKNVLLDERGWTDGKGLCFKWSNVDARGLEERDSCCLLLGTWIGGPSNYLWNSGLSTDAPIWAHSVDWATSEVGVHEQANCLVFRYYGCGSWAGKIFCVLVAMNYLFYTFLEWFSPRSQIDLVPGCKIWSRSFTIV